MKAYILSKFGGLAALLMFTGMMVTPSGWAHHEGGTKINPEGVRVFANVPEFCIIEPPLQFGLLENWWDDDGNWRNDRQGKWLEWIKCTLGTRYKLSIGQGRISRFEAGAPNPNAGVIVYNSDGVPQLYIEY